MIVITKTIQSDLLELAARNERIYELAIRKWFGLAVDRIQRDLKTKFIKDVTSELTDWSYIEQQGQNVLKPATLKIMQSGGNAAFKSLAVFGSFDVLNVEAVKAADKMCAKLVREVTKETKAGIRTYISTGIKEGKSMPKIARELRPLVGLTDGQTKTLGKYRKLLEDKEKYPKLKQIDIDRKVQRRADKIHRARTTTIARTETARAQNIGYCQGLAENGVEQVEFSNELDACEICIGLSGKIFPVGEGAGIIPVHPNCHCAMLPVIDNKTLTEPKRRR